MIANGALSDIRVLDLSRILAGPYCTMMLADYGADVLKVEQPGRGDGTRQWGPPWVGAESAYFLCANRNKRSMTLNLKTEQGNGILRRLAATSDVLVENFKVGTMERMGLDYASLRRDNQGLIYCSISGYGQTGPYRDRPGYDFMIQAQGGIMSITGPADGEPSKVGVAIVDITAALYACNAILAALHHRATSGEGQHIDVALLDAQVGWLANVAQNYFATGAAPGRYGNAHANIVPYETFRTADGYLALAIGNDSQFKRFCHLAERPDLWQDQRFQSNAGRVQHRSELVASLRRVLNKRSTAGWMALLLDHGIPASPINDIPTVLDDPQIVARNMVQRVEHEAEGNIQLLGPVAKLSSTPARVDHAPPTLGADTRQILATRLGYSPQQIDQLFRQGVV